MDRNPLSCIMVQGFALVLYSRELRRTLHLLSKKPGKAIFYLLREQVSDRIFSDHRPFRIHGVRLNTKGQRRLVLLLTCHQPGDMFSGRPSRTDNQET